MNESQILFWYHFIYQNLELIKSKSTQSQ